MNPETLRSKVGTHVTGADFWRGEPPPENLAARLQRGESVKIFGLRRIGKSSLLYETVRLIGERAIVLDGQQLHSVPNFLKAIFEGLPRDKGPAAHVLGWVRQVGLPPEVRAKFEALITERVVGASEPALDAYAELLFRELGNALRDLPPAQRPVLFIDELPFFCDNVLKSADRNAREATASRLNNLLAVLYPRVYPLTCLIHG